MRARRILPARTTGVPRARGGHPVLPRARCAVRGGDDPGRRDVLARLHRRPDAVRRQRVRAGPGPAGVGARHAGARPHGTVRARGIRERRLLRTRGPAAAGDRHPNGVAHAADLRIAVPVRRLGGLDRAQRHPRRRVPARHRDRGRSRHRRGTERRTELFVAGLVDGVVECRVPAVYSLGVEGALPRWCGRVHASFRTPDAALALVVARGGPRRRNVRGARHRCRVRRPETGRARRRDRRVRGGGDRVGALPQPHRRTDSPRARREHPRQRRRDVGARIPGVRQRDRRVVRGARRGGRRAVVRTGVALLAARSPPGRAAAHGGIRQRRIRGRPTGAGVFAADASGRTVLVGRDAR